MKDLTRIEQVPPVPDRPLGGHKGTFGTVLVVGGSRTMMGAPALCAAAALRAGAGLVKVATSPQVLPTVLAVEPCATGILLEGEADQNLRQLDEADPDHKAVLAVGPGMGKAVESRPLLKALLRGPRAMVLDADGLNLLAQFGSLARGEAAPPLVLTPHPGEFRRLARALGLEDSPTDEKSRPAAAARLAQAYQAVVLLKGHHTVVSDGQRLFINTTGNPALATAGAGDVLTGLIAALMAQRMEAFDAAVLGAHLHGAAADLWSARYGSSGLTARDLAQLLPEAFHRSRA